MLDAGIQTQIKAYFDRITHPITLQASLDGSAKSHEMRELLEEIAGLSDRISLDLAGSAARRPSFAIRRDGSDIAVTFAGLPMGHEFNSLILALLQVGGHPSKEAEETIAAVKALDGDFTFETYFSLTCQNCPDVVQALNLMSVLNPRIRHVAIDGALYPTEVEARQVLAVPSVFLNGEPFAQGRMNLADIVARLDKGAATRAAAALKDRQPFDVLVIGGGPAGATAAIYAARKGIRTGLVAERFGGQVLDTLAIENLVSVPHTEGPQLAAALESNVRAYDVDIIGSQTVEALIPAKTPGGFTEVRLASGASLRARTLVVAPGARWRKMNVPGEDQYLAKGVAYCPHCDGPLFKGKRVAVIGGGNSGAEAAIDLAGIVAHVTLIEFDPKLRADAVLQAKLKSLKNVDMITSAQTTEVHGDGARVTGLTYIDRSNGTAKRLDLEGIFVQIGLVPSTEWLKGTLALTARGEIEIDARGQTSVAGIFAAGDATTVPYKQIVVALGEGAKAALSAFDYLIRQPEAVSEAA
ncbi:MAG: alkyl hydroperoxide reductase subunit F [Ancalomicrobiaceae bacterium]|nr:alkyl hydroperoxide reductase subunit F [Ancalomicrobiaceae bacterium]